MESVSFSFKYIAGYSPSPGHPKQASEVQAALVDTNGTVVALVWTSKPLGNYSFDHFTGYSPPIDVNISDLHVPNSKQLMLQVG